MSDNLTDERDGRYIDPERYSDDDACVCQQCGSWLNGSGDGSTVGMRCPECEVMVWIA